MNENNEISWEDLSNDDLVLGLELMVTPNDLKHRDIAMVILTMYGYSASEVKKQIESREFFNDIKLLGRLNLVKGTVQNVLSQS